MGVYPLGNRRTIGLCRSLSDGGLLRDGTGFSFSGVLVFRLKPLFLRLACDLSGFDLFGGTARLRREGAYAFNSQRGAPCVFEQGI